MEEITIFKKKGIYIGLLIIPILLVIGLHYSYDSQFSIPTQKENANELIIANTQQIFTLQNGWRINTHENNGSAPVANIPFHLEAKQPVVLSLLMDLPMAEQVYKIHLDGLQQPFEFYVNGELIESIYTFANKKRVQFYAKEQQVQLELKIYPTNAKVSLLKVPIFGQAEAMQQFELKEFVIIVFTLLLLMILSIYTLVLYFTKQRLKVFLYISCYLTLVAASLLLSGEQLGQALFPTISSVTLFKLKTTIALIAAIVLISLNRAIRGRDRITLQNVSFICSISLLIGLLYLTQDVHLKMLEACIWLYLLVVLVIQLMIMLYHFYKNNELIYKNLALLLGFLFLSIYMSLRIYYNVVGTNIPTHYWLIAFTTYMLIYILIQTNRLVQELEQSKISYFNAQIKPHFIYNALTSIIALCYTDNLQAARLLGKFSTYLRLIFENSQTNTTVLLQDELKLIDAYVEIEMARFPNRIHYEVTVDESALNKKIPSLTIQPFVENAIRHGLFNKIEAGHVQLRIHEIGHSLKIEIVDDGVGMDTHKLETVLKGKESNQGIGIQNTLKRLHYMKDTTVEIQSEVNKGTSIFITLPIE
ncbi:histidine kinase [Solibacillus sp. CAU 1738]|uniref:sensor histidine kinase n=1 Tax=Solibacillus sp. CAU 1738 TaxID=3140363 RepID=UPI003260C374